MMKQIARGVYPTMITPYREGKLDLQAASRLVEWYIEKGCDGIFAVCQSSEMQFLSLAERKTLAACVYEAAKGRVSVVTSGHCAESLDEQAREAEEIYAAGSDAFVLVSNRLDLHNDGDDVWIANAKQLLAAVDPAVPLGIYECPRPYKRLLSEKILDYCIESGRFVFIKDTCCCPVTLNARLKQLAGTGVALFNANAQTLLDSLRQGAAGYSGIMANFHPELLNWLCRNHEAYPEQAEKLAAALSMEAFTELDGGYPCTAKYYFNCFEGVPMSAEARSCAPKELTPYRKLILAQMHIFSEELKRQYIG